MPLAPLVSILKQNWLLVFMLAGLLLFVLIHLVFYIKPSKIDSLEQLQTHLTNGQPTVVEFYSNL